MGINRLAWDSDFFGLQVGETENDTNLLNLDNYDLIIIKQNRDEIVNFPNFEKTFQETKVIFNKILNYDSLCCNDTSVIDFDDIPIRKDFFYPLAFESGKYSRFKLDPNFNQNKFELLYCKWVDNSVTKEFADKIFYIKELNQVIGFVSVKNNFDFSTIGLIAVDENHQGKGIGKKMVLKVEQYCMSKNIFELRIPTQKENIPGCHFYSNMGFFIKEETIFKHYWKISYIKKNKF